LYLQKGVYNGKRILPASWVEEATAYQVPNAESATPAHEWNQGYGYQFWRSRHHSYRADGAMGQYCLVLPDQDAVVAITSETANMGAVMNHVWTHLLPAMQPKGRPANARGLQTLRQKLASLTLLPALGQKASPLVSQVSGKSYQLAANDLHAKTVSFTFKPDACTFQLQDGQETHRITCGLQDWVKGESRMPGEPPHFVPLVPKGPAPLEKVAAFGTWTNPQTFVMTWVFNQTPHSETVTCKFEGETVQIEFQDSVAKKAPERASKRPVLQGKRIS
jgi:hypothetical protein